jgi:hypothetical protein
MKKLSEAWSAHRMGGKTEVAKNARSIGKSVNLENFLFADGSSIHYQGERLAGVYPKFFFGGPES